MKSYGMRYSVCISKITCKDISTVSINYTVFIFVFVSVMKYSNYIGILAAVALIACCFVPWVYIISIKTTITGVNSGATNFGRPGAIHIILCVFSIILFLLPKVWAIRTNLFTATFNFAWAIRNFLLITHCEMGECPEKRLGIYGVIILSFFILLMALFPKMDVED